MFSSAAPEAAAERRLAPEVIRDTVEEDPEEDKRRTTQRDKQIGFGFNTDGYKNMMRLIQVDPTLQLGGVLPLKPPAADLQISKRHWDMLARKWRRALHMFDHVFIEGEDEEKTTLEQVVEKQRRSWVNEDFVDVPKDRRVRISKEDFLALRNAPAVPKKIPLEDNMAHLLRSRESLLPIASLMDGRSPTLVRQGNVSPTDAGVKVLITPLGQHKSCLPPRSVSPELDSQSPPSTVARRKGTSPTRVDSSPSPTSEGKPGDSAKEAPLDVSPSANLEQRFQQNVDSPSPMAPPPYNDSNKRPIESTPTSKMNANAAPYVPPTAPPVSFVPQFQPMMMGAPPVFPVYQQQSTQHQQANVQKWQSRIPSRKM